VEGEVCKRRGELAKRGVKDAARNYGVKGANSRGSMTWRTAPRLRVVRCRLRTERIWPKASSMPPPAVKRSERLMSPAVAPAMWRGTGLWR
jgi:hypothetical protein